MMCHVEGCGDQAICFTTEDEVVLPLCLGCALNAEGQGYEVKALKFKSWKPSDKHGG